MRMSVVSTAILLAGLVTPAFAQQSSREDFKEYCKLNAGRWIGDVTWVADWPGFGKKGDKVTAYFEAKVTEDGNAMATRFFGGEGSGTGLYFYDAGAEQIRGVWCDSAGAVSQSVTFKKDGQWIEKGAGSLRDGAKTEFTSTLTVSNAGKTITWTDTGTVGDKKTDDQHDVYRRVSK